MSYTSATVEAARPGDLEETGRLFHDYLLFYERDPDRAVVGAYLHDRVTEGDSLLFVARLEDRIVGFVHVYPGWSSLDLAPAWTLEDLFVIPTARRQGVARSLIGHVHAAARAAGAVAVRLETSHDNLAAQRLYESIGYRRDEVFRTYSIAP